MSIEAMRQALEALETVFMPHHPAVIALRTTIEQAEKQEPYTEWLVCPKCNHKSPYSPIKAKTNEEDAERVTKQARAALEREKQEPVAYVTGYYDGRCVIKPMNRSMVLPVNMALYTTPPAAQWFGLTEKDFSAINQSCLTKLQAATSAESILKEKNT
jgi:hypothetical protein